MFAQSSVNKSVVGERNSLVINFSVSSLVNQFSDGLSGGISKIIELITRM